MKLRTIMRTKVVLPVLTLATVGAVAATASADSVPQPKTKASRETSAVMRDVREGKARNVTPPGRGKHTSGVWTGCRFVYLTTDLTDYRFEDGSVASISENPEPMPPKDPNCIERNPTEAEMNAMRAIVDDRNAGHRPNGAPAPPPAPRPRHLDPDYRPETGPPPRP